MEIKKGNKYKCIKDSAYNDSLYFNEGVIYTSEMDGYLTNNFNVKLHTVTPEFADEHFVPYIRFNAEYNDNVNHPSHYTSGDIECIDAMIAAYGKEAVMAFCKCNAFKYQWRFDKKNGIEDIKKAQWYQNKYIELSNGNKGDS